GVRLGRALAQFGNMRRSALGALLAAVENARKNFLKALGLQKAMLDVVSHDAVELVHRHCAARTAGLALASLGRAGVVPVASSLPGPQRHRLAAAGAEEARAFSSSPFITNELTAITGVALRFGSALIC